MLYDTFMDWFAGSWNNQHQAYSNPRGQSFVNVRHRLVSERVFSCTYTVHRQRHPYRNIDCTVFHNDGTIVLRNPVMDLNFSLDHGTFVAKERRIINGILHISEAYLNENTYNVVDTGIEVSTGSKKWGLEEGAWYQFDRVGKT